MNKRTAIKAYCRECAGGSYPEVILCHIVDCPLWPYRTGYSAKTTAKSAKQALIRHPDIAKELADLGLDACFSQNAIKKPATWRRKSTGAGQTTGVKGKEVVDSPKHVIRKKQSGDALTGVHDGPLEAQDERRRA